MEILIDIRPGGVGFSNKFWEKLHEEYQWDIVDRSNLDYEDKKELFFDRKEMPNVIVREEWNNKTEYRPPLDFEDSMQFRTHEDILELIRKMGDKGVERERGFGDRRIGEENKAGIIILDVPEEVDPYIGKREDGSEYISESHKIWTGREDPHVMQK